MSDRREFRWGAQRLADPDPSLSPEEVRDLYAQIYPELTTAAVVAAGDDGGTQIITLGQAQAKPARPAAAGKSGSYEFKTAQGTRG